MSLSDDASRYIFDEICNLNYERFAAKGVKSGLNKDYLFDRIKKHGIMNYLIVGDKVVAGTIASVYNNQLCLHVIAHDNKYNRLNLGNVILLKTIEYAINRDIHIFNFLWGDCEYKTRFGAKESFFYHYYVYREKCLKLYLKKNNLFLKRNINKVNNILKTSIRAILRPPYHAAKWLYHNTIKRASKAAGYIFMLHRVDELKNGHLWCNEHMKVTPAFLDEQLELLKQKFDLIPLSEVPSRLQCKMERRFIAFTMDDGYKDNYTKALPVFKKHNVPYTIFVTTDFPDREAILWWYELEDLLLKNESLTLANGVTYPAHTYEEKCDSFLKIREEILKLNQLDLKIELNKLFANYNINWTRQCEQLCLSWDDIRALKTESLVTIGAHTQHHYNLKALATETDVRQEVENGTKILKEKVGIETTVFAYPFGSENEAGKREEKVLSKMPFALACRAFGGACFPKDRKHIFSLPRLMFKQGFTIEDIL